MWIFIKRPAGRLEKLLDPMGFYDRRVPAEGAFCFNDIVK
jgi:hypothetical protein